MPRPRFEKLPAERRRELLAAASAEFAAHGFEGASTNRIIASAGVSKGAMYYYFDDKADLYATVVAAALEALGARIGDLELDPAADAEAFFDACRALLRRAAAVLASEPELVELARGFYRAPPAAASLRDVVARSEAWFARTLERGRKLGAVRDDVPADLLTAAATSMCLGMDGWLAEHWDELDARALAALETPILVLLESLIAPPAPRRAAPAAPPIRKETP